MGELPVVRRFDGCTMTLGGGDGSLPLLAVDLSIIREHVRLTLGTRQDTSAAYGQAQLESRRTATMLGFAKASQIW